MKHDQPLEALHAEIYDLHMEGGWHRKYPALWQSPAKNFLPYRWSYSAVKPVLEKAGGLVNHQLADRRNLTMTNPVEGNPYSTVRTLVAAYQLIKQGESADSHRHTPNALRIILEGHGSYTVVDGVRVEMRPGDVLLTPSMCWHSHEAVGPDDCFWVDVLDVPLVHLLEPMFFERHPNKFEDVVANVEDSPIAFRWEDSLRNLDNAMPPDNGMANQEIQLGNPALKTTAIFVQRMQAGFKSPRHKTTANSIFVVIEGDGCTTVGDVQMSWTKGDVFVVPAWQSYCHEVSRDAHLVRVTDQPVMNSLGFLHSDLN